MAVKLNSELAAFFETGDQPSEAEFGHLIDSILPAPAALTDAAAVTLTKAANQGRVNVVADLTQNSTFTIPAAAAAGEYYNFVYVGGADEAHNHIFSLGTSNTQFFIGNVMWVHDDGTGDAVFSDGDSNELLTLVTPMNYDINILAKSTTEWYLWGSVHSATIPTIGD
mgnify:CR=1 FL=1|tara:strand:+ start:24 stop:527 length:504 start_codon:yes stop_codon:yes gene_type:complete